MDGQCLGYQAVAMQLEHSRTGRCPRRSDSSLSCSIHSGIVKPVSSEIASIKRIKLSLDCRNCERSEVVFARREGDRANMFSCHCIVCGYSWRALFPRSTICDLVLALERLQDNNSNETRLSSRLPLQQEVQSGHFQCNEKQSKRCLMLGESGEAAEVADTEEGE